MTDLASPAARALAPLAWSEPRATGYASISAEDHHGTWRITPVPRDVARVRLDVRGRHGVDDIGYGESAEEARMLVDVLRTGTDDLAPWRDALFAANFARTYPDAKSEDILSDMWHLRIGGSGRFQITVSDRDDRRCVHATYERSGDTFWHNVCRTQEFVVGQDGGRHPIVLPDGVDVLKAGIHASLAILAARAARTRIGFAIPLGGATR